MKLQLEIYRHIFVYVEQEIQKAPKETLSKIF